MLTSPGVAAETYRKSNDAEIKARLADMEITEAGARAKRSISLNRSSESSTRRPQ